MTRRVRRSRRRGRYIEVPTGDLATWERSARLSAVSDDAKRVVTGTAQLIRRAVLVDGAKPGDRLWIDYDELARLS